MNPSGYVCDYTCVLKIKDDNIVVSMSGDNITFLHSTIFCPFCKRIVNKIFNSVLVLLDGISTGDEEDKENEIYDHLENCNEIDCVICEELKYYLNSNVSYN